MDLYPTSNPGATNGIKTQMIVSNNITQNCELFNPRSSNYNSSMFSAARYELLSHDGFLSKRSNSARPQSSISLENEKPSRWKIASNPILRAPTLSPTTLKRLTTIGKCLKTRWCGCAESETSGKKELEQCTFRPRVCPNSSILATKYYKRVLQSEMANMMCSIDPVVPATTGFLNNLDEGCVETIIPGIYERELMKLRQKVKREEANVGQLRHMNSAHSKDDLNNGRTRFRTCHKNDDPDGTSRMEQVISDYRDNRKKREAEKKRKEEEERSLCRVTAPLKAAVPISGEDIYARYIQRVQNPLDLNCDNANQPESEKGNEKKQGGHNTDKTAEKLYSMGQMKALRRLKTERDEMERMDKLERERLRRVIDVSNRKPLREELEGLGHLQNKKKINDEKKIAAEMEGCSFKPSLMPRQNKQTKRPLSALNAYIGLGDEGDVEDRYRKDERDEYTQQDYIRDIHSTESVDYNSDYGFDNVRRKSPTKDKGGVVSNINLLRYRQIQEFKAEKERAKREEEELNHCTFHPQINRDIKVPSMRPMLIPGLDVFLRRNSGYH